MNAQYDWQPEDFEIEHEVNAEILLWREKDVQFDVPRALDQKIAKLARYSMAKELNSSWLLSQSARLLLAMLVFFAISIAYLLSLG